MDVSFRVSQAPELDQNKVLALYRSVSWTAYTDSPIALSKALEGSDFIASAWVGDELVGLVRALSDDASIMYLQDILVQPAYHRTGIGRALAHLLLDRYSHVRQRVLLTYDEPSQRAFYESLGFTSASAFSLTSFVAIGTNR